MREPGPIQMHKEKILAVMILNDEIGMAMNSQASDTYWRGFIVQDRATGTIALHHRFRYRNGDSWHSIELSAENQAKFPARSGSTISRAGWKRH